MVSVLLLLISIFAFYLQQLRRRLSASQQHQAEWLAEQKRRNEILEKHLVQQDAKLRKLDDSR